MSQKSRDDVCKHHNKIIFLLGEFKDRFTNHYIISYVQLEGRKRKNLYFNQLNVDIYVKRNISITKLTECKIQKV